MIEWTPKDHELVCLRQYGGSYCTRKFDGASGAFYTEHSQNCVDAFEGIKQLLEEANARIDNK